jgi:hypothetical protein
MKRERDSRTICGQTNVTVIIIMFHFHSVFKGLFELPCILITQCSYIEKSTMYLIFVTHNEKYFITHFLISVWEDIFNVS